MIIQKQGILCYIPAMSDIGEALKQARQALGMTQEQAAEQVGVTQPAVSYWENGKRTPDADDLRVLSQTYDTDPGSFFAKPSDRGTGSGVQLLQVATADVSLEERVERIERKLDEVLALMRKEK